VLRFETRIDALRDVCAILTAMSGLRLCGLAAPCDNCRYQKFRSGRAGMDGLDRLDFVLDDLNRQREILQSAIDDAKRIAEGGDDDDPAALRAKLEAARTALNKVILGLQANTTATATAVQATILNHKLN
jgi:hypothetical protein